MKRMVKIVAWAVVALAVGCGIMMDYKLAAAAMPPQQAQVAMYVPADVAALFDRRW
jgi:hypothetical protein